MTQVVLEQLTSGVAITRDWSIALDKSSQLVEDSSDSDSGGDSARQGGQSS